MNDRLTIASRVMTGLLSGPWRDVVEPRTPESIPIGTALLIADAIIAQELATRPKVVECQHINKGERYCSRTTGTIQQRRRDERRLLGA